MSNLKHSIIPTNMQVKETLLSMDIIDEEEDEETLSLCDLPLHGADQSYAEWEEDLLTESQGVNATNQHQDYFEFSPQLNPDNNSTTETFPESIIFCGKVIPYKEPDLSILMDEMKQANTENASWRLFRWRKEHDSSSKRKLNKRAGRKDIPIHKVSILTSSSSGKSKWYLLLFGSSRFSAGMEWTDIKSRQSQRRASPLLRFQNDEEISECRNKGCGLWWLIEALSCGVNHHPATNMVAAQCL